MTVILNYHGITEEALSVVSDEDSHDAAEDAGSGLGLEIISDCLISKLIIL